MLSNLWSSGGPEDLVGVIRRVRNRWRVRIALRGLAVVLAAGLGAFLVSSYGLEFFRFSSGSVVAFRLLTWLTVAGLAFWYLIRPLARKVSDERVALYLEEHEPSLDASVLSALEETKRGARTESPDYSAALVERLVRTAVERCHDLDLGSAVERQRMRQSSSWLALASAASKPAENGAESDAGGDEGDPSRVILPRKTLSELARLLAEDAAEEVAYEQGENHLFFDVGARQLISRTIDAQFPAHERVLPKGNDKRIEFDRDRLVGTLKRVALLSNERPRAVKFQIDAGGVEISSSSPDVGEASEVLAVDYEGPRTEICFNAQYVLDFLGVVDSDSVGLEFKDEVSQAVLLPSSTEGCEYTYVIMPMRV